MSLSEVDDKKKVNLVLFYFIYLFILAIRQTQLYRPCMFGFY